jgi:trigger factor
LKVSSEKIEGCQVALTVEVEPDEMGKALDGAYRRLVGKVAIPGFRKGKAPRALLERHIGKESMDAEALEYLVPELYDRAIDQEQVEAIGQPNVEITQNDPPIFKATVPVRPVVELGDYRSISVTSEKVEITEENVDEGIKNLRQMQATWEPVERESRIDDLVTIDVEGIVEDKTVLDRKEIPFRLSADATIPVPGFVDQVQGMKAGEQKEFTIPFPDDNESEELAGKDCLYKISMTEVKEEHLPEVDEEFVKSLGQEIETVEQLRERLLENITAAAERERQTKLENDVIDAVAAVSQFEFPAMFTEQEIDRLANEQVTRMGGMQIEDFLRYRGITAEDFRNELRPMAEKRVMSSLLLNKVHDAESIEVSDDEITAGVDRLVEEAGEEQGEMVRKMFESPEARESITGRLLTEKTLKLLIEIATADNNAAEEVTETEDKNDQSSDEAEPEVAESSEPTVQAEDPNQQSTSEEDSK